jgi:hypothetical protein
MPKRKTSVVMNQENYLSSFKELISLIKKFQELPLTSTVFEFLESISPYDHTITAKKEIIRIEHPSLWKFSKEYNNAITLFNEHLKEKYNSTKPKERKAIAEYLEKVLTQLSNKLTEDKVKAKIVSEFTDENRYNIVEHFGIKMREFKPHIWKDFKPELLGRTDLFEEYFGWLYEIFILIGNAVEDFSSGYKKSAVVKLGKNDFSKKPKIDLTKIIIDSKWDDFIRWCKYYSEKQELKDGSTEKIITYIKSSETFRWNGIGKGKMPSLGVFIKELFDRNYFTLAGYNKDFVFIAFLNFFFDGTHTVQQARDLAKYAANKPNRYKGYFNLI